MTTLTARTGQQQVSWLPVTLGGRRNRDIIVTTVHLYSTSSFYSLGFSGDTSYTPSHEVTSASGCCTPEACDSGLLEKVLMVDKSGAEFLRGCDFKQPRAPVFSQPGVAAPNEAVQKWCTLRS